LGRALKTPLTLGRVFFLTLAGLALLGAVVFALLLRGWRQSLSESSEALRNAAADRVEAVVNGYLDETEKALTDLEQALRAELVGADDAASVERALFGEVLSNPGLAEVTFTRAERLGFDEMLGPRLAPSPRWQISVYRDIEDDREAILARHIHQRAGSFVSDLRPRLPEGSPATGGAADDPTEHPTFQTTASAPYQEDRLWSDLHFTELDAHLPEARRRVVVTVMKAVTDSRGRFLGVLRVGSRAEQVEGRIQAIRVNAADPQDPHRVFLCDERGRLLMRLSSRDRLSDLDGDLRVMGAGVPAEIALALRHPALGKVGPEGQIRQSGQFEADGRTYLVTFLGLGRTQGWRVGIVGPEDYYLRDLERARRRLATASLAALVLALLFSGMALRTVRRGLGQVVESTNRMQKFEFEGRPVESPFRDVVTVMEGLELAKTAMRAMSRYVPVDLVRHLYETRQEPVLGGELRDVSIMFTDIQDFTRFAEEMPPDALAQALGRYLEVMTKAIHGLGGTIDKFIGDAIMAIWNAPRPSSDHAERACGAALACVQASRLLHESPEWEGRPPFHTRFGIHRDRVLVGHFGAPDRMSYTALGDGVNLASRLEALNKQYGTAVMVSEAVHDAAQGAFAFRLLDRVAVKGKTRAVRVYELLGPSGATQVLSSVVSVYERALGAYFDGRFDEALALLQEQAQDGPSRVLAERCRALHANPPPADWDGVYVARVK
jgi:adenylate cyclase